MPNVEPLVQLAASRQEDRMGPGRLGNRTRMERSERGPSVSRILSACLRCRAPIK